MMTIPILPAYDLSLPSTEESSVRCPYCGQKARKATGKELYPQRQKLWKKKFLACTPCEAWVGCHEVNPHKWEPFGTLANKHLRRLRMLAHDAFDPIWKRGYMHRPQAYNWLAGELGIHKNDTHIGLFDEATCRKVIEVSNKFLKGRKHGTKPKH